MLRSSSPFGGVGGLSPTVYAPNTAEEAAAQVRESLLSFSPLSIHRVALGLDHSLCVGLKGEHPQLFAWGRNRDNVLGLGLETRERVFPGLVPFFAKHAVFGVAAGNAHSLVLLKRPNEGGGKVYSVGLGTAGRLGYPKKVSTLDSTAAAAAALGGEAGDDEDGSWFAPTFCRIRFPDRARIARISSGAAHSLAVSDCGVLYAWGQGCYGALGLGDTACSPSYPVSVSPLCPVVPPSLSLDPFLWNRVFLSPQIRLCPCPACSTSSPALLYLLLPLHLSSFTS
ncbi:hypothetical protein Esti_002225 [Eimeria stiedai]